MSDTLRTLEGMSVGTSLYDVLGVASDVSRDELTAARRRLAARWHPDRHPDDPVGATARLQVINAAYDVLADPGRRQRYDAEHRPDDEYGFEFLCGDTAVVAERGHVRCTQHGRTAEFARTSVKRAFVRRHQLSPGWATLVIVTTTARHQLRLPEDAANALAAALLRR
jgi:curved DNA-binding protein CbpA